MYVSTSRYYAVTAGRDFDTFEGEVREATGWRDDSG